MPFAAIGMDLRYCVSEISQREGNILCDITCMWNLKKIQQTSEYKQKKKKSKHRYREQTNGCQWGGAKWDGGAGGTSC